MPVTEHLAELVRALDAGWKQMAERLEPAGKDAKVSLDAQPDGRVRLNVEKLDAIGAAIVLWTTKYIDAAVEQLKPRGMSSGTRTAP
ncbi:hypothetical protein AB0D54_24375 [Streptomyces xanthophaeus]